MFKITTNREIKINKGDDSGKFPLFINRGTPSNPLRYEFLPRDVELTVHSQRIKSATVDIVKFKKKFSTNGDYTFTYLSDGWNYLGNQFDIDSVGIKYAGTAQINDNIVATVTVNKEEVYLYIFAMNSTPEKYLVKKTFTRNGYVTTDYSNKPQRKEKDDFIINNDGDMVLRIDAEDTANLDPGQYCYLIKARVFDQSINSYVINTIIENHPFYITSNNYQTIYDEEEELLTNLPFVTDTNDGERGYVESVNGYTGVVVLDYNDVGAEKEGAAQEVLDEAKAYTDRVNAVTNDRISSEVIKLENKIDETDKNINSRINREVVYLNERLDNEVTDQTEKLDKEIRERKEADAAINTRIDNLDYEEQTFTRNQVLSKISQSNGLIHTETRDLVRTDFDTDFFAEHQVENLPEDLQQLQVNIDAEKDRAQTEEARINKRIDDLDYDPVVFERTKVLSSISQSNGLINVQTRDLVRSDFDEKFFSEQQVENLPQDLNQLQININNEAETRQQKDTEEKNRAVSEEARLDKRIDDLDVSINIPAGKRITKVIQQDGFVNVNYDTLKQSDVSGLETRLGAIELKATVEEQERKAADKQEKEDRVAEDLSIREDTKFYTDSITGSLSNLTTEDKTNLVAAIDELQSNKSKRDKSAVQNNIPMYTTGGDVVDGGIDIDTVVTGYASLPLGTTSEAQTLKNKSGKIIAPRTRTDIVVDASGKNLDTKFSELDATIATFRTAAAQDVIDNAIKADIKDIQDLIPEAATVDNKLTDKDFVNSSIATNTATFRGTYKSVAELPTTGVDNNDYAFVEVDVEKSTVYDRYKYDGKVWAFEYRLNNSKFTSDQWKAINSGITEELQKVLSNSKQTRGIGWTDQDSTVHKIDPAYISTEGAEATKVLMSDGNGNASWQTGIAQITINDDVQPIENGQIKIKTDKKSVLYDATTKEIKLPDKWAAYLKEKTFDVPSIDQLVLKDESGTNLNSTYELGKTYVVSKISHKESNISNIDGNLLFNGTDSIVPSSSNTEVDVSDTNISSTTTFTLSGKYIDTVGAQKNISKSSTISFNRYAYTAVTSSDTAPTTGTQRSTVSTFASSGAKISYNVGDYIYFYTTGTGKKIQVNVLEVWSDVSTTEVGKVTFTQQNGTTFEYDCYRVGPFIASGSDTYRV